MHAIRVIDSHTGGEPTRLVLDGGPELGAGALSDRVRRFRENFDAYRRAIVNEPRGSQPLVGALLVKPGRVDCDLGVIFFNNVGYLGMCGHGMMGLIASLAHANELGAGTLKIDTPVGAVECELHEDGRISVCNVVSFRAARRINVEVSAVGPVTGDVAWGGNWFFLISEHEQIVDLEHIDALIGFSSRVRAAINGQGYPMVDHVELCAPAVRPGADSRNFVLCPGNAYDRSPCGTGTSAKIACLAADDELAEGATWVQESVIGSTFTGRYRWRDRTKGEIVPTITGTAYVTGEAVLRLDPADPFCWGIGA
ncbi:MAG: proline racemase family protein [Steroidobacteraceae bacterium]